MSNDDSAYTAIPATNDGGLVTYWPNLFPPGECNLLYYFQNCSYYLAEDCVLHSSALHYPSHLEKNDSDAFRVASPSTAEMVPALPVTVLVCPGDEL